jgi:hypothetical protein
MSMRLKCKKEIMLVSHARLKQVAKPKKQSKKKLKYLIKVPIPDRLRHIIYYPIIWKIYNFKFKQVKYPNSILLK